MNIKLNEKIISDRINLPDEENKVFQGICNVGNFVFVTAYDDNGDNSVIYILDGKKHIKTVTLYNNSHVGGICFDNINNLFWITDKDRVAINIFLKAFVLSITSPISIYEKSYYFSTIYIDNSLSFNNSTTAHARPLTPNF